MRIGLDFRFLALGRQLAVRGIPRFTQEQLQSVLALDHDNTYLLLCNPGDDLDPIRPEIRAAPNAHIVCAPEVSLPIFSASDDRTRLLARYSGYQRWLEGLHLDLYHSTCHFWLSWLIMPGFDVCPYVVTSYDLIPLLYQAQIPDVGIEAYELGLLFLEQATRIAAISQSTADDLVKHLGITADRIDLTPPAISPCFRPISHEVTRSILGCLDHPARHWPRRQVRIPADYVLSVTDLHYTKNLSTLLAGYSRLPVATRRRFPLVIAGQLRDTDLDELTLRAERLEIDSDLILTGRVSDHELMALYNGATLLVHPSHYEGFGLTVAEAMRCGAPVITTSRSSLPEVTGDAAVHVASEDASAFAEAIDALLHDGDLRDDLRRRGPLHAGRFTTAALGRATLDCYRKTMSTARTSATLNPLRVALWTPVAPQMTGVSSYADDLITELTAESRIQVDVFVGDGVMPPLDLMRKARVRHWSDFDRCARKIAYDATIYQLGASPLHLYMQEAMLRHPGIVVLHDLTWSRALLAGRRCEPQRDERFRFDITAIEGEGAGREWDKLSALPPRQRETAERVFLDDHPMLRPVIDAATSCVALTPEAAAELMGRYPATDAAVIPIGIRDTRQDGGGFDRPIARACLGLDPEAFVVVTSGPVDAPKHVETVLDGFAAFRRAHPHAVLAVVGWTPDPAYAAALQMRAEHLRIGEAFRLTGALSRTAFDAYMAAADVVVVLRDERSPQIPGVVPRAFAAGRCVVVSDVAALAGVPDSACVRIGSPPDAADVTAALSRLAADAALRADLERGARAQYEKTSQLHPMVEAYQRLIRERARRDGSASPAATDDAGRTALRGRPSPRAGSLPYNKVCELEDFAHPQLRAAIRDVCPHKRAVFGEAFPRGFEHSRDWEAAMAVRTLHDNGALRGDARVLVVGSRLLDTACYLTRRAGDVVAVDTRRRPEQDRAPSSQTLVRSRVVSSFAFQPERLTMASGDGCVLGYPDAWFDAVVASLHPSDVCSVPDLAGAIAEMGRVLKPGGLLSLSTDVLLWNDPGSAPPVSPASVIAAEEVQRIITEADGLEPIDDLHTVVSHWTRATERDVAAAATVVRQRVAMQPPGTRLPLWSYWALPYIVVRCASHRYTSVHLALRRTVSRPN